jgi:hypothetical protein
LLLIAILAMLPLHGIQAALATAPHHPGDAHAPAQHAVHVMLDAGGAPACQMNDQQTADSAAGHACAGSGCDMCGACTADLPRHPSLLLPHGRTLPEPGQGLQQPRPQAYALFRPPRA